MFYDALDKQRNTMLSKEYEMRDKMDTFEDRTKNLIAQL